MSLGSALGLQPQPMFGFTAHETSELQGIHGTKPKQPQKVYSCHILQVEMFQKIFMSCSLKVTFHCCCLFPHQLIRCSFLFVRSPNPRNRVLDF